MQNLKGNGKQELNQSPLPFMESRSQPGERCSQPRCACLPENTKLQGLELLPHSCTGMEEALKRKDSIIRVRNAQIAALWDELHTRQPWKNALEGESLVSLPDEAAKNASRALVVFGINTVSPAGRALV